MSAGAVRAGLARNRVLRGVADAVAERPWLLALAVGLVEIVLGWHGPDSPAAGFRTWLVRHNGLAPDATGWYDGQATLGYSVLAPALAALVGVRTVSLASAVLSTRALTGLVRRRVPGRHVVGLCWFAVVVTADLALGRDAFALGLALGISAVSAADRDRRWLAAALAVLCSLSSPLAAGFLLFCAAAWWPRARWRAVPLVGATVGLVVAEVAGGGGGLFPYPWPELVISVGAALVGILVVPRRYRTVRLALVGYIAVALVLFVVPNPIGGNWTRGLSLLAGPVAAIVLVRWRRQLLALLIPALLAWQLSPVAAAVADGSDPSARPAYYQGLLAELRLQPGPIRLEIPFTRDHWEASLVAPSVSLARGWERQQDIADNPVLYAPHLTDAGYLGWLRTRGVTDVALPDVPLDPSSRQEAALLRAGVPGLVEIWRDQNWTLWRVTDTAPLADNGGRLVTLDPTSFTVALPPDRTVQVLLHYSNTWQIVQGQGCVGRDAQGWIEIDSPTGGLVTVAARIVGGRRDLAACQALPAVAAGPLD